MLYIVSSAKFFCNKSKENITTTTRLDQCRSCSYLLEKMSRLIRWFQNHQFKMCGGKQFYMHIAHRQHTQRVVPSCSIDLDCVHLCNICTSNCNLVLAQKFTEWRAKHFGGQSVTLPENVLVFSYQRTRWWIRCNGARQLSEQTEFHIYFHFHWLYETHRTDRESEKPFRLKTWHTKKEPKTQNWKMLRAKRK